MMFLTKLQIEALPSGRYKLLAPLEYRTDDGDKITVPTDYATDFFSVPRPLWPLFPRDGRGKRAAVVHDYIYTDLTASYTRAEADRIFRQALAECGVGWAARWTMWAGVRVGGDGNW